MTHIFEIQCAESDTRLLFTGAIPHDLSGYDGCNFEAALSGGSLPASVMVYDIHPHRWAEYFSRLAASWRGWRGEKAEESLEGHLRLAATSDSLGHIAIRVTLCGDPMDSDWRAEKTIFVESGMLERMAKLAATFFPGRSA